MRLFPKKKIHELIAVKRFVSTMLNFSEENWQPIALELRELSSNKTTIPDDENAAFEFALATLAWGLIALPNLFNTEQAKRIHEIVLGLVAVPEKIGAYSVDTINDYQKAWYAALEEEVSPIHVIASLLFDKLRCNDFFELNGVRYKNPVLIMALTDFIVKAAGGGWWKRLCEKYCVIPLDVTENDNYR